MIMDREELETFSNKLNDWRLAHVYRVSALDSGKTDYIDNKDGKVFIFSYDHGNPDVISRDEEMLAFKEIYLQWHVQCVPTHNDYYDKTTEEYKEMEKITSSLTTTMCTYLIEGKFDYIKKWYKEKRE